MGSDFFLFLFYRLLYLRENDKPAGPNKLNCLLELPIVKFVGVESHLYIIFFEIEHRTEFVRLAILLFTGAIGI